MFSIKLACSAQAVEIKHPQLAEINYVQHGPLVEINEVGRGYNNHAKSMKKVSLEQEEHCEGHTSDKTDENLAAALAKCCHG